MTAFDPEPIPSARSMALGAVLLVLAGCTGEPTGPVTVRLFGREPATPDFRFFQSELSTLEDLPTLRGGVARFVSGADLVIHLDRGETQTVSIEHGAPTHGHFVERDGVHIAMDLDSLLMASSYWGIELAATMFRRLGVEEEFLTQVPAYHQPRLRGVGTPVAGWIPMFWLMNDNAAYFPELDAFLFVPHVRLQGAPFQVSPGVIAHEYAHRVFQKLTGAPLPDVHEKTLLSVNEGLSDLFGALLMEDPDFADLPGRDLSVVRRLDPELYAEYMGDSRDFDPHALGAVVASALWRLGEELHDHERVARAALDAERRLRPLLSDGSQLTAFTLTRFWSTFLEVLEPRERPSLCALVEDAFALLPGVGELHPCE